jgi:hypothetical protein
MSAMRATGMKLFTAFVSCGSTGPEYGAAHDPSAFTEP